MKNAIRKLFAIALALSTLLGAAEWLHAAPPLKVMSFNIRYGSANDGENAWPKRKEAVVETIRRCDPDVLGLQEAEAFQLDYLMEQLPGYTRLGVGRTDGKLRGEFAALLLRTERFTVQESGTRWLSDTPELPGSKSWQANLPRVFTWALAEDKQSGKTTYFNNAHWDHQSQVSREKSAAAMLEHTAARAGKETPAVLMGDFNAGADNPAIKRLMAADSGLRDAFLAADPSYQRTGTFNRFRGVTTGPQIDWLFVSDHWRVDSAGVITQKISGRVPSDHFPVWAVMEMPGERP